MRSGGWIKFDKDMAEDPRLVDAATILVERYAIARLDDGKPLSPSDASRFVCNALRGAIVTLWCYADRHVRDDDSLPCDARAIDIIVGIDGFCDAMPNEWVTVGDDGTVTLPGYCAKNGLVSQRKKDTKGAERQRRYRERLKASRMHNAERNGGSDVTHNGGITQGGDQDQDEERDEDEERTTTLNGEGKGNRSIKTLGEDDLSTGNPLSPPQEHKDPRDFDTIKAVVLTLAQKLNSTDPDRIVKLGGASHRLSPRQARAAIKQLREDGKLASIGA
jgi:hypothetical protein